jgi:hypothetical protein
MWLAGGLSGSASCGGPSRTVKAEWKETPAKEGDIEHRRIIRNGEFVEECVVVGAFEFYGGFG